MSEPLDQLLRLQLALATEPERLAHQLPCVLLARQHALWQQLQLAVQGHYGADAARARELLEQLLASLLLEECCRQALRWRVPLREALGQDVAG